MDADPLQRRARAGLPYVLDAPVVSATLSPPIPPHRPTAPPPPRTTVAERPAALVVLVYMLATLPALLRNGLSSVPWAMAAGHVAIIVALAWATRRRGRSWMASWLPLALTPFFYAELPTLIGSTPAYRDATVQGWEGTLFGSQPAHTLARALPWPWLSELLHLGYFAYYALIFVPPLLLWRRGRDDAFARTALAVMGAFVACYVAFILFPVEGPRYAWAAPPGIPDGPVRRLVLWVLASGSSRGTAFPSSHAAVAVASSVAALRFQPRVGAAVATITALLLVGAVYGGFHYATDMLVGALLGAGIAVAAVVTAPRAPLPLP